MTVLFPAATLGPDTTTPLILALPKGRILSECGPLLARAGIVPSLTTRTRTAAGCASRPTTRCWTWSGCGRSTLQPSWRSAPPISASAAPTC